MAVPLLIATIEWNDPPAIDIPGLFPRALDKSQPQALPGPFWAGGRKIRCL